MHYFDYKWTLAVAVGNFKVRKWWVCTFFSNFQLCIAWKSAEKYWKIDPAKIEQCTVLIINGL
jgi:hypothetical protein